MWIIPIQSTNKAFFNLAWCFSNLLPERPLISQKNSQPTTTKPPPKKEPKQTKTKQNTHTNKQTTDLESMTSEKNG